MNETEFAKAFEANMDSIKHTLVNLEIYDDDLFNDTYIALYEYAENKHWIRNFKNAYVDFYWKRFLRQEEHEANFDAYDDEHLYNLDVPDESDLEYREQVGSRVDRLLRYYYDHPQPKERNHKRACRILQLYLDGRSEREIARKYRISHQAVHQNLERIVQHLKLLAGDCIIEGIKFA